MAEQTCPNCGMRKSEWSENSENPSGDYKGYRKGDKTYCCKGCAEGSECICLNPLGTKYASI